MSAAKTLIFYLEPAFRKRAEAGKVNFVNKIVSAFASRGYATEFKGNSDAEIVSSVLHPGYALYLMEDPVSTRGLTMRLAYFYPFWRIETTAKRWEWQVATMRFDSESVDKAEAVKFARQWRKRLFGDAMPGPAPDGHIYVPLQGRLTEHRSFQTMRPIDMIAATLVAEPNRRVVAGLHPKETYVPDELRALHNLVAQNPNLSVSDAGAVELVKAASCIVTQNSAVAMTGYFFHKPVVLFGRVDFHHIAANVHELGVAEAFRKARHMTLDFDAYLFWFLQKMSINAGREDAKQQILATVRAHGWQV
ncbi:MAG: hypothetical protein WBN04_16285 [Paracoccaceae bacterium]